MLGRRRADNQPQAGKHPAAGDPHPHTDFRPPDFFSPSSFPAGYGTAGLGFGK